MLKLTLFTFSAILLISTDARAKEPQTNLGEALTSHELKPYDITIFPNGKNLPKGQGSVLQGKLLYKNKCSMCHGKTGIEGPAARLVGSDGLFSWTDPLRILRIKDSPMLVLSVGGMWPYATTIFDYTRRAMPHYAPKSLSNEEVYALTAYILYRNNLIDKDATLNKDNILTIEMPAKKRSVSKWQP